jgi:hypothetical protein
MTEIPEEKRKELQAAINEMERCYSEAGSSERLTALRYYQELGVRTAQAINGDYIFRGGPLNIDSEGFEVGEPIYLYFPRPWYVRLWRWLTGANRRRGGTLTVTAVDKNAGVITFDDSSTVELCGGKNE